MRFIIVIACLLHVTYAAPQFLTFKDGKIGVNFFGYHAEAGLGGALGHGGPLGGLSASAGTPWGQHAEAGLGGTVQGRAAGGLYAGAQAIPGVAAGTFLAGDTSQGGVAGSESHAFGVGSSSKHTLGVVSQNLQQPPALLPSPSATLSPPAIENTNVIQKVHSPKKYSSQHTIFINNPTPSTVFTPVAPTYASHTITRNTDINIQPNIIQNALQIPIGILQSLQDSLSGFRLHATKSTQIHTG